MFSFYIAKPHIIPSVSPSSGPNVSPSISPHPQCTVSKWSPWINRDKPDTGSGDHEAYTPEEFSKFCPGGEITDIECVTKEGISSYSAGEIITCNKNVGLKCENKDNDPIPCSDYKIRYFCKCSPLVTPYIGPSGSPTVSPPTGQHGSPSPSPSSGTNISPSISPQPQCTVSKWTPWINRDKPDTGNGDHEAYTPEEFSKFCPGGEIMDIECVTKEGISSYSAGEIITCNKNVGLKCENKDNDPIPCSDYKIRYFCKCSPLVTPYIGPSGSPTVSPPTGQHGSPSPSPSSGTNVSPSISPQPQCTVSKWSPWINRDKPDTGSGDHEAYTPEEFSKFCPGGEITDIECVTSDGIPAKSSGEMMTCDKNVGLKCENKDNEPIPCSDYKIRYFCKCSPLVTPYIGPSGSPTVSPPTGQHGSPSPSPSSGTNVSPSISPQPQCTVSKWSPWINRDKPDTGSGDHEAYTSEEFSKFCPGGEITDIECVTKEGISSYSAGEIITCNKNVGLKCENKDNDPIPCSDYKIRYFCKCSPVVTPYIGPSGSPTVSPPTGQHGSPSPSPSSGTNISPSISPQPQCTVSKWSPWINRDKPDTGSGDHEAYTPEEFSKFCPGGEITDIECVTSDGIPAKSSGEMMTCDKNVGLKCENKDNEPIPCSDYKIRYFCKCSPLVTPYIGPSGSPTVSPPTGQHGSPSPSPSSGTNVSPSISPQPQCTVSKWSPWINRDKPDTGNGDHEAYTPEEFSKFCPGGEIMDIECMTSDGIPAKSSGEMMTCDKNVGLKCENKDNEPIPCSDYKIRYFCKCSPLVTPYIGPSGSPTVSPPTGQHGSPSPSPSSGTNVSPSISPQPQCTVSKWSPWINRDKPDTGNGDHEAYTPEEFSKFCPGGEITDIECVTKEGISSYSAGEIITCNKNVGLKCENKDNDPIPCSDYKIRYFCKCSPLVTPYIGPSGSPTVSPPTGQHGSPSPSPSSGTNVSPSISPQPQCTVSKWSPWINRDKPDTGSGDHEAYTPEEFSKFCPGGEIMDIECMTSDGIPAKSSGEMMTCDKNVGLKCENKDNEPIPCSDYKIRYFCKCSPLVTPYIGPSGSPTVSPPTGQHGSPSPSPSSGTNVSPSISPQPQCTVSKWSPWINRDKPDTGSGDHEAYTSEEFSKFCPGGEITDIECVTKEGISSYSAGEIITCNKNVGLKCENKDNDPIPCSDYKIRYFCKCSPLVTPYIGPSGSPTVSPPTGQHGSPSPSPSSGTNVSPSISPQPQCTVSKWSPWINRDKPDTGSGDHEAYTPEEFSTFCPGGEIMDIECMTSDGIPAKSSGEMMTCDKIVGLKCENKDNEPIPCSDYKIRYLCKCAPSGVHATPGIPWIMPSFDPSRSPTPVVQTCTQSVLSPWVNKDTPDTGDGDHEFLTTEELARFCVGGVVTHIECYSGDIPYESTGEIATCDLKNGLVCNNKDNEPVPCSDYKVRYLCECTGKCFVE